MSSIATSDRDNPSPDPFSSHMKDNSGVGLSNPQLSHGRREMLDLVNRLHSTGVQIDIDLPQIAVIGSQSAGKSSLIESISGITLPRATGTCTRCPTECRLSRTSEPWRCIVSLRFIRDAKGQVLGQARNEQFGDIIVDKAKVEERIRRAQRAILNPTKPAKYYLTREDEDMGEDELSFSINCVSLQIGGPDVADLSFCDLPGLIASVARGGNTNDIALVESLVTSYIKKPSCIILLTVACETDFENQGAHGLAKIHDPDGKRTIGVLTKPDRIPSGDESNWLQFIRNEKEALENNWYCVKQPSSSDLKRGITWAEARQREDEFFSMTPPWSELDAIFQKYLRTSNLVGRLSSILSDLISRRLPQIQEELEKSIFSAREALNKLPKEPAKNPQAEIASLLHGFVADLAKHVEGIADEDGLLQAIRPAQEKFRRAIRATAPEFRPFERRYAASRTLGKARFLSKEEGYEDMTDNDDDDDDDDGEAHSVQENEKRGQANTKNVDAIYVDEVLTRAHQARTRELPGNYPFVVQKTFIDAVIKRWHIPAQALCRAIHVILTEHTKGLVRAHFASFGQGGLEQRVRVLLQDHIKKCMERAEAQIAWLLSLEARPFSLNLHYYGDYKAKFLSYYKGSREKHRHKDLMKTIHTYTPISSSSYNRHGNPPPAPTGVGKVLAGLIEMGITGVKPEDIPKLLPPDEMEPAIVIMADVRAYFQVAYKRFADNVPLAVDHELVCGIERNILNTLYAGLGINGLDGYRICSELAQESPHIAHRREELLKKLERLDVANQQLLRIGL